MKMLSFNQRGQSLLEVLVAMAAVVIVITAITTVVLTSLRNAQTSRNQDQGAQYAQEGMEYLRQLRSSDYATFNGYSTPADYCLGSGLTVQASNVCLSPKTTNIDNGSSKFIRYFHLAKNSGSCPGAPSDNNKEITMYVLWTEGRCGSANPYCAQSKLVSCFTPYNVLPAL